MNYLQRFPLTKFFLTVLYLIHPPVLPSKNEEIKIIHLYDASLATHPEQQGWIYLTNQSGSSGVSRSVTGDTFMFDTRTDQTEMAGFFSNSHPAVPQLDRTHGFSLEFELQIVSEEHSSQNRAGFSIILLASDNTGVELAFWGDEIWAYSTDFTRSERVSFNTMGQRHLYTITIENDQYTLHADNTMLLNGSLRDYSGFGIPYNSSNFIFFGDNTSRAGASINLSYITLTLPDDDSSRAFSLSQNYPNPFQMETTITYTLFDDVETRLDIVDLSGRVVQTLVNEFQTAGTYRVLFDAVGLSSGSYFYRLSAGGQTEARQLTHIR